MDLSPFDYRLMNLVRAAPGLVRVRDLQGELGVPVRTVRHYLRRLEIAGRVYRPAGSKSGYCATPFVSKLRQDEARVVAGRLDGVDVRILRLLMADGRQTGALIAQRLGFGARRVQYRLAKLEGLKCVRRPVGKWGGYEATIWARDVVALANARQQLRGLSGVRLRMLAVLADLDNRNGMLLHSEILAGWLDMPARTVRYHLHALEEAGLLVRPRARNGGYQLVEAEVRAVLDLARREGLVCQN